jgi:plastocyanin
MTASPTSVAVQAPGPVGAGPTRFEVTRQGDKDLSVYFLLPNAGVSLQELRAALARDDRTGGDSALGLVWIQASVSLGGRDTRRGVTFTLRPGLTYVVVSEADEAAGRGPKPRGITTFTTSGESNRATAGAPDATVRMAGLRFRGDRVLPRRGTVRVKNNDGAPHFAIAFPLRKGVTSRQFGRAIRGNSERAFGRVIAGAPYNLQGVISGGNTANDQEVRFPKAGRYGMVCFIHEHHRLGMHRIITVR